MPIIVIHTKPEFKDSRGGISRIIDTSKLTFQSVLRITSKKGTVRSNHYHKKDSHYLYVESGKCEYSEKPLRKKNATIETVTLVPGDVVLSKPNIIHAVKFLKDSVLYAFTTEKRNQDVYEKDTVRITIIE